jgi:hypothetical protein
LLDSQLKLSSPFDSLDDKYSNKYTKDKDDKWYNLPSDLDDLDDDSIIPALVLPPLSALSTTLVIFIIGPKEHSTSARIKAIYMLKEKKSLA